MSPISSIFTFKLNLNHFPITYTLNFRTLFLQEYILLKGKNKLGPNRESNPEPHAICHKIMKMKILIY